MESKCSLEQTGLLALKYRNVQISVSRKSQQLCGTHWDKAAWQKIEIVWRCQIWKPSRGKAAAAPPCLQVLLATRLSIYCRHMHTHGSLGRPQDLPGTGQVPHSHSPGSPGPCSRNTCPGTCANLWLVWLTENHCN